MQIWHIDFLPLSNSKFVCDSELLPVVFAQGIAYMLKINVLSIVARTCLSADVSPFVLTL